MEYIQGSLFGKTFQEHSAAMKGETLGWCSENLHGLSNQTLPMCLSLKMDGITQAYYWSPGGGRLLGELRTRNSGEFPNAAVESHLSWILEANPHPKYSLSAKACQGILNRAERRGKILPETLRQALESAISFQGNCIDRADNAGCNGKGWTEDVSYTLNVIDRPAVYDPSVHHGYKELGDISETVRSRYGTGGNNVPMVVERTALSIGNGQTNNISMSDKANAQDTMHDQQAVLSNVVRRLTPLEAERLQGYPDGWTDVPGASDSKRYKALGNSIALPFWEHLAHRFVEIGNVQTIGSLFAGIGGFELVFHRAGAETKWTSEIDPFCESVVKYHCESGDL